MLILKDGDGLFCSPEYPQPTQYLTCPNINIPFGTPVTCEARCPFDSECSNGQKCCSNGCAISCMVADRVPYYNISTQQCPDSSGLIGICAVGCRGDYDCQNNQMCCSNGCGQTCTASTTISQRCSHVRSQFNATAVALGSPRLPLGAYIPQCDTDGNYSPVQYHEGFSWCVHTQTGLPLSGFYGRGEMARCRSESVRYLDVEAEVHNTSITCSMSWPRLVTGPCAYNGVCGWDLVVSGCNPLMSY